MGGVEDDEPPLKRTRASLQELSCISKSLSLNGPISFFGDAMPKPLPSLNEKIGSKGIIKKVEFLRIITKALYSLGYERSGALLEEESGIPLHSTTVNLFRQQILNGSWDESVATLQKIVDLEESILKSASFLIFEQKFFELLSKGSVLDALKTLRTEITPLCIHKDRVHELASCIVSPALSEVSGLGYKDALCGNPRLKLLEELQKLFPPAVMLPESRLEHLIEQSLFIQRQSCIFHNSVDTAISLYNDHRCGRDQIPTNTLQVLQSHQDEVWFLQFSHGGKFLASSSYDCTAIIWEVNERFEVFLRHTLIGHQKPVFFVTWSPDDRQLLTCGLEETVRRWDVASGICLQLYEKNGFGMVSCGWFPDGKMLFTGVKDKSVCIWDLEGKELECWKAQRSVKMSDIIITKDGKIVSMDNETNIILKDRENRAERVILEKAPITSFSMSRDNDYLLVNLSNQEIHLWSIADEPQLVTEYQGHKRTRLDIRSCFGGSEEAFIASGSEDSLVYIWHRNTGKLLEKLTGHSGAVNCVSWNPVNPYMLASASDDRTIRVWGLAAFDSNLVNGYSSNGITHNSME